MGVHVDVRPVHLCILASNIKHLVHSIMYMLLVVYYKESGILILDSTFRLTALHSQIGADSTSMYSTKLRAQIDILQIHQCTCFCSARL